ncbi:pyridoxal phosphate-dependent transferase, partial [Triangularia verruculosa]
TEFINLPISINFHKLIIQDFIQSRCQTNPYVTGLTDYLRCRPGAASTIVTLDYSRNGQSVPNPLTVAEVDLAGLMGATSTTAGRIVLVENIQPHLVSFLGQILDVDPIFFAGTVVVLGILGGVIRTVESNPILVSVDLRRLRELADKYDVPVVIDDTIGSFCNIDVLPVADVVITSTTKSLSGYANSSSSPTHKTTTPAPQSSTRNTHTLAKFLHADSQSPTSPITATLYPPYLSVLRPPTPSFPEPGYGCLLAIEFTSLTTARAFYDNLSVYHGPHLGAHHTLAFPFNDAIWGIEPEAAAYLASFGARPEQVRVSVGLESEEELVETFWEALRFAEKEEVKRKEEEEGEKQ